ncbi:MAG: hypothetical protein JXA10_14190, partial [Anaerolineae bacterium]|nr:hypothetical protein [Anaerolineae bacterium]
RAGYWDTNAIADEWHMYLKSYFRQGGEQRLQPIFLPFLANATTGDTLWGSLVARYRQTFRHAWGAKEISYAVDQFMQRSRMPFGPTVTLISRVAHDNILAGAGWALLFFGAQMPMLLNSTWTRAHLLTAPFLLLNASLGVITLLTLIFWIIDQRIRPSHPDHWTPPKKRHIQLIEVASLVLVAVVTVICVALPVLHSQTWLMLGKSIRFRVTAKT